MIRRLARRSCPCIDVNMFILCVLRRVGRDEHVVELLKIHVEMIRISLYLWNVGGHVQVLEFGNVQKRFNWLGEYELIEIARCNDYGIAVLGDDISDELLQTMVRRQWNESSQLHSRQILGLEGVADLRHH